ncbi:hypothetical protein ABPG72_018371 [Tetrahymena utriculariae]
MSTRQNRRVSKGKPQSSTTFDNKKNKPYRNGQTLKGKSCSQTPQSKRKQSTSSWSSFSSPKRYSRQPSWSNSTTSMRSYKSKKSNLSMRSNRNVLHPNTCKFWNKSQCKKGKELEAGNLLLNIDYSKKQRIVHLTDKAKMNRLKHCEEYQDHTLEKIIFSDESFFREFYASDYCWSGNGQIVQKEMKSTDNYGCVMVFGAISYEGKSKLWIMPKSTTITAEIYQDIMIETIIPFAKHHYKYRLRNEQNWFYQQDNATSHTAKVTKRWFEDHQIKLFPHPPCSPDLNPIEMLWGIMKQALTNDKKRYNRELLIERLIELWNDIDQSLVNKLIDHTKCVYKEVIANQGDYVKNIKKNKEDKN